MYLWDAAKKMTRAKAAMLSSNSVAPLFATGTTRMRELHLRLLSSTTRGKLGQDVALVCGLNRRTLRPCETELALENRICALAFPKSSPACAKCLLFPRYDVSRSLHTLVFSKSLRVSGL